MADGCIFGEGNSVPGGDAVRPPRAGDDYILQFYKSCEFSGPVSPVSPVIPHVQLGAPQTLVSCEREQLCWLKYVRSVIWWQ